jgi:hypothetical protein
MGGIARTGSARGGVGRAPFQLAAFPRGLQGGATSRMTGREERGVRRAPVAERGGRGAPK